LYYGPPSRYLQAITTLKHWDAYSLEDYDGVTRHDFDAVVSNYDLQSTYFPGINPPP
jgi:xylan 1,4-beta-xylosidase